MALEMKYFVLKPASKDPVHARASRMALFAYANAVCDADPLLAEELRKWAKSSSENETTE